MKKFTLLAALIITITFSVRSQVARNLVVVEITTSTQCTYCPGAMMGLDDLYTNGKFVAGIEHHNSWQGTDPFVTTASQARSVFYNPGGNPGAFFDGGNSVVGGNHTTSMYSSYLPKYNAAIAKSSPVQIEYTVTQTGQQFVFDFVITKVASLTNNQPVFQFVVTQSNIQYNWQGQNHLEFVNRLMVPGATGTPLDFTNTDVQNVHIVANIDPLWPLKDIEFVGFVQNNTTKEILNGMRPVATDFIATTPTTVCQAGSVSFENASVGHPGQVTWLFEGGTPSVAYEDNVSVVYDTPGSYKVTLVSETGLTSDTIVKAGFVTINPGAVMTIPEGAMLVCTNTADQPATYTTTCPAALTYEWEVIPAEAGTLTNNGSSCIVLWKHNWFGKASIRVRGTNDCGQGDWTPYTDVTLTTCVGADNNLAQAVTVYPNPATRLMNVSVNSGTSEILKVKLTNALGNTVYNESISTTGKTNHVIDVARLAEGVYFLTVEGKKLNYSQKVTVQH